MKSIAGAVKLDVRDPINEVPSTKKSIAGYGEAPVIFEVDFANFTEASRPIRSIASPRLSFSTKWRQQANRLQKEAHVFYFAFKHPGMPWYARLAAAGIAAYLFSPVQFIPSFIPVIGFVDDFLVLFLGVKLLRKIIPLEVLTQCRALADAAEIRKKEEIRSTAGVVALVLIVLLWLFAAISGSALIVTYIYRH